MEGRRLDTEVGDGLFQPGVVGEDDHLLVAGALAEDGGQPFHLLGVHRLHRIVDDEEAERALACVARGMNSDRASECSSPWLITLYAGASWRPRRRRAAHSRGAVPFS